MVGIGRVSRGAVVRRWGIEIALVVFLGVPLVGASPGATASALDAPGRSVTAAVPRFCACRPFVTAYFAANFLGSDVIGIVDSAGTTGSTTYGAIDTWWGQPDRNSHPNLDARIVAAAPGSDLNTLVVDQYGHVAPVIVDTQFPAQWHGDITFPLRRPIVGIATYGSRGYWLVASDGGVFRFGAIRFYGSMGGRTLNSPIVAIVSAPNGDGYWLVASDGGVFSFGSARFHGSTGHLHLARPIVGGARTPSGNGYWLVASDGGVFAFGDARFYGSAVPLHLAQPVVSIASTSTGKGYWITTADHNILNYGDAFPVSVR